MTTLPLDVCNEIISSLDISTLNSCSLVNRDFHRITQLYVFKHIVLDAKTWKAKCNFLLSEKGLHFLQKARKLTANLENMMLQSGKDEEVSAEFVDYSRLMREIGPQLTTFRIEGLVSKGEEDNSDDGDAEEDEEEDTRWPNNCLWFRSQLFTHIIPYARTLEFINAGRLPVFKIINEARHLQTLYFKSDVAVVDYLNEGDNLQNVSETADFHLTFGSFSSVEFYKFGSLGSFMRIAGAQISTLELQTSVGDCFPSLFVVERHDTLRNNLRHLVLGEELYKTIIDLGVAAEACPFGWFTSLEVLTLHTAAPSVASDWPVWFHWITLSFYAGHDTRTLENLRTLKFVVPAGGVCDSNFIHHDCHSINRLKDSSSFNILFYVASSDGIEKTRDFFSFIRSCLILWQAAGRLVFRVDLDR
ncbi:hypothetical protein DL96DRAFT_1825618 [Flagelloscypha sp. PMI_526]|nr:hypothetical protein DL96DRAFT_1825618 [Flagelloscypha sp. PMI_526]